MNELVKLGKLDRFARQVADMAQSLLPPADALPDPGDPLAAIRPQLQHVAAAARSLSDIARSPVKIGIVGEFSAGKTLLLGALTGSADQLPIDESPTTGNVTALDFVQGPEGEPTEAEQIQVQYLDDNGVALCLAFMLLEARTRAHEAQLPPEAIGELRDLMGSALDALAPDGVDALDPTHRAALTDPDRLTEIQTWCKGVWGKSTNPRLRFLIRELLAFVRAYARCGAAFCRDARVYAFEGADEMSRAIAGLRLPPAPRDLMALSFADLPPSPPAVAYAPETLSADQLQATFPLVRRVHLRLRVPRDIWDLAAGDDPRADADGRPESRFTLLDFPGLGADNSGVRDLYLCLSELQEVQTILILLRGNTPGGDAGLKLYNYMQRHRPSLSIRDNILVGVGRFDQLPLDEERKLILHALGGTTARPAAATAARPVAATSASRSRPPVRMARDDETDERPTHPAPPAGKLTEDQVLTQLPILKTAIAGAESLIPPDLKHRIVFLSPMLGLKSLADENPTLPIGSEIFRANLDGNARLATEMARRWKAVADQLDAAEPGLRMQPGLARWLDDFAADGGIGRLRALLQSHVTDVGLTQLYVTVKGKTETLQQALRALGDKLGPASGSDVRVPEDKLARGRTRLRELTEVYQNRLTELNKRPELTLARDGVPVRLNEILLEEVADEVLRWPEWRTLLQASRGGEIREPEKTARPTGRRTHDEDYDRGSTRVAFPNTSDDFYPHFEATLQRLEARTRALIGEGVDAWLNDLAAQVAHAREELAGPLERDERGLARRIWAVSADDRVNGLVKLLKLSIRPDGLRTKLYRADGGDGGPDHLDIPIRLDPDQLFPLARTRRGNDGKPLNGHQPQMFAWARDVQTRPEASRPPRHQSHQGQMYRLRDTIVTTLAQQIAQVLAAGTQIVLGNLRAWLEDFADRIPFTAREARILEEVFRSPDAGGPAGLAAAADPLTPARQLAALGHQNLDQA